MSRRADIIDILRYFLDFNRNRTGKSIILFLMGIVCLGWIASTVYGFFNLLSKGIIGRLGATKLLEDWRWSFWVASLDVLVSFAFFGGIYWLMKWHLKPRLMPSQKVLFETPQPHEGLIFLLSPYNPRGNAFDEVSKIALDNPNAREHLLKSNWGPLVVAAQHHAQSSTLKHCWLICTEGAKGSAAQSAKAEELVKHFAGKKVQCHQVKIESMNDVGEVTRLVDKIYEQAPLGEDLLPEQIIADFTGGTAAMSGGLMIATLLKDRHVQYFSQDPDKPLFKENGQALTPQEIAETGALITVVITNSEIVRAGEANKQDVSEVVQDGRNVHEKISV